MGKQFKAKWVECTLKKDSFKYKCRVTHKDKQGNPTQNIYRFQGKPLTYLVKNEEDYKELISLPDFIDYKMPGEKPASAPSETTKERKLREAKEAKENAAKLDDEEVIEVEE